MTVHPSGLSKLALPKTKWIFLYLHQLNSHFFILVQNSGGKEKSVSVFLSTGLKSKTDGNEKRQASLVLFALY